MARAGPRVTVRVKAFVSKPILRCFLADLSAKESQALRQRSVRGRIPNGGSPNDRLTPSSTCAAPRLHRSLNIRSAGSLDPRENLGRLRVPVLEIVGDGAVALEHANRSRCLDGAMNVFDCRLERQPGRSREWVGRLRGRIHRHPVHVLVELDADHGDAPARRRRFYAKRGTGALAQGDRCDRRRRALVNGFLESEIVDAMWVGCAGWI